MKLLRVGAAGEEKPAIIDEAGLIRDLSSVITDLSGAQLAPTALEKLQQIDLTKLPILDQQQRIGACVANAGKFICIGLNFADHAAETGAATPDEPEVFSKWTSCISGANDNIIMPKNSTKLDWEVELGIVIGSQAKYVEQADAEAHIAGYCVINDVSERQFQLERGSQWDKGKGCDSFGPIGPWLVTKDEIEDVDNLSMWLEVNGKRYQNGSTKTMIFNTRYIVSYLSQFMTLNPGDIISTGTPPGVGLGQTPPTYLQVGDTVNLGIEGLGTQSQTVTSL